MPIYNCSKMNSRDIYIISEQILEEWRSDSRFVEVFDVYVEQTYPDKKFKVKIVAKGEPYDDPDSEDVTPDEWNY